MKPYAARHAFWFWRQALPVAMLRVLAGGILAGGILAGAVSSLPAAAQTFAGTFGSEGPAPTFGAADIVQSRDAPPNGTVSGAVQAILTNPTNPNSIIIGSTNGGNSWTPLQAAVQTALQGKSVVSVVGYGSGGTTTILAATYEPQAPGHATGANGYGLYMSTNGGNFQLVNTGAAGAPPVGAATSLVGQGTAASPYYVAITADTTANSGVFRSVDGGATWTQVLATGSAGGVPPAVLPSRPTEP